MSGRYVIRVYIIGNKIFRLSWLLQCNEYLVRKVGAPDSADSGNSRALAHTTVLWIFNTKSPRNANGRYITFFREWKAFEIPTREKFALQIGYEFEICQVIRILISSTQANGLRTNGMHSSTASYFKLSFFCTWHLLKGINQR